MQRPLNEQLTYTKHTDKNSALDHRPGGGGPARPGGGAAGSAVAPAAGAAASPRQDCRGEVPAGPQTSSFAELFGLCETNKLCSPCSDPGNGTLMTVQAVISKAKVIGGKEPLLIASHGQMHLEQCSCMCSSRPGLCNRWRGS